MKTIKILALEDLFSPKGIRIAKKGATIEILEPLGQEHIDAGRAELSKSQKGKVANLGEMIKKEAEKRAMAMEKVLLPVKTGKGKGSKS